MDTPKGRLKWGEPAREGLHPSLKRERPRELDNPSNHGPLPKAEVRPFALPAEMGELEKASMTPGG